MSLEVKETSNECVEIETGCTRVVEEAETECNRYDDSEYDEAEDEAVDNVATEQDAVRISSGIFHKVINTINTTN